MSLERALASVEGHVEQVSLALLSGDAVALQNHSQQLRDAAVAFSALLDAQPRAKGAIPASVRARMDAIHNALSVQREGLARLTGINERQLATVVPATASASTYGGNFGGRAGGGAARIYRAAG